MTPGLTSADPLDYATTWGHKQRIETTKKLVDKNYAGNAQNLKMFLDWLADRVTVSGWESITFKEKDLIMQYGVISIEACRDEAKLSAT